MNTDGFILLTEEQVKTKWPIAYQNWSWNMTKEFYLDVSKNRLMVRYELYRDCLRWAEWHLPLAGGHFGSSSSRYSWITVNK